MSLDSIDSKDFVYFNNYDKLFNYKNLLQKLNLVSIQNFVESNRKFKTLICYDMQGGYHSFDRFKKKFYD